MEYLNLHGSVVYEWAQWNFKDISIEAAQGWSVYVYEKSRRALSIR